MRTALVILCIIFTISFVSASERSGVERTVRVIYFSPNDRSFRPGLIDSIKTTMLQVQALYKESMKAHGHGDKTFLLEMDDNGEPVIHYMDGEYPDSYYSYDNNVYHNLRSEVGRVFDLSANNIYLVVIDFTHGGGLGGGRRERGFAFVTANTSPDIFPRQAMTVTAHELGHTFGWHHDFRDWSYVMSYGGDYANAMSDSDQSRLSKCFAEFLTVHPYFDHSIPFRGLSIKTLRGPEIDVVSPLVYPAGSTSVPIQLKVSDPDGIHQVRLHTILTGSLKLCRKLDGETSAVVHFDYDGVIPNRQDPHGIGTSLSGPFIHQISIRAVDSFGNTNYIFLTLRNTANPDFNGDGEVNISDFLLFVDQFGLKAGDPRYDAKFDLDGNGSVSVSDFLIFATYFGK